MKRFKLFIFVLALVANVPSAWADASGSCGDDLNWTYVESTHTLTITGYGDMYDYTNSSSSPLAPWYSYRNDITSVSLPDGLTRIGNYAFLSAQITSFTLPSCITSIGNSVFHSCPMTDVYVSWTDPTAITLATGAFNSNKSISNVNLHVPAGTYALYAANAPWSGFNILDPIGGKCGDNLIWSYNSSTTTLTFTGSGDMYSYAEDKVPWKDYKPYITSIVLPEGLTIIGGQAFQGCTSLPSIDIPSSVTMIYGNAFNGCTNLETVTFAGSNLTLIGGSAFKNCTGLTSITLPNSVATISAYAFSGCTGLTSVTLSEALTSIANYAFSGCTGLHDVTVHWTDLSGITTAASTFNGLTTSNINLHVPAGTYATYAAAAPWSSFKILDPNYFGQCGETLFWEYNPSNTTLTITGSGDMYNTYGTTTKPWEDYKGQITSVVLPDDLTSIGKNAFYQCSALTSINIPATVESIGQYAFCGCTGLQSITIPASVTSIGNNAFKNCTNLAEVHFAAGIELTSIGDYAFSRCYALTSITIPESVLRIKSNAFYNCTGLSTVIIPSSVKYIEGFSFQNCTNLHDVYVNWGTNPPSLDTYVFDGVDIAAVNLHLPFAAWSNYETATTWKNFKHVPVVTAKGDPEHAGVYYSTFYHVSTKYALPAGVEAYTAQLNGAELNLTKIAEEGDVLPAATAVILKSSVEDYELVPSDASPVTAGENDLQGVDAATSAPANCYVLSGQSTDHSVSGVGFYQFSGTLGAHKAYLTIPSGSPAPKRICFAYGTTTDIEATADAATQGAKKMLRNGQLVILLDGVEYNAQGQFIR
ncbi:MAG: leucine-rich repeat protein [Paludibacteraceae bacterium]|nr:leucine-rich repeat protein [Paludibacteraceae bacterium]